MTNHPNRSKKKTSSRFCPNCNKTRIVKTILRKDENGNVRNEECYCLHCYCRFGLD